MLYIFITEYICYLLNIHRTVLVYIGIVILLRSVRQPAQIIFVPVMRKKARSDVLVYLLSRDGCNLSLFTNEPHQPHTPPMIFMLFNSQANVTSSNLELLIAYHVAYL